MKRAVYCDECGNIFEIDDILLHDLNDYVVIQYFACPHCGKRYKVAVFDSTLAEYIDQRTKLEKSFILLSGKNTSRKIKTIMKKLNVIKQVIQKYEEELEQKHADLIEEFLQGKGIADGDEV